MGKDFMDDEMRIQTLHEQGLGYQDFKLAWKLGRTLWTRLQI